MIGTNRKVYAVHKSELIPSKLTSFACTDADVTRVGMKVVAETRVMTRNMRFSRLERIELGKEIDYSIQVVPIFVLFT